MCTRAYMQFDLINVHIPHTDGGLKLSECFLTPTKEIKCIFIKIHLYRLMLETVRLKLGDGCMYTGKNVGD